LRDPANSDGIKVVSVGLDIKSEFRHHIIKNSVKKIIILRFARE